MRRVALIAVIALLVAPAIGVAQGARPRSPAVTLAGTEAHRVTARETGTTYDVYVSAPDTQPQAGRRYPVIYVLDGQWDFKLILSVHGGLRYDGLAPDAIIVGIVSNADDASALPRRSVDLTPVADASSPGSGGGPKFLAFLERELIPLIEREYPADPQRRILVGNSLGGLFSLYAMFTRPTLFGGYLASSPAVTYGQRHAFAMERAYAAGHRALPARLYVTAGSDEGLARPVADFVGAFGARHYDGVRFEGTVVTGAGHTANKPEGYNRGLAFLFAGWR